MLPPLFLDDFALDVELLLRQRWKKEAHPVRLQPEAEGEIVGGKRLVVIRPVERGAAVEHTSHGLHVAKMFVVADVLRAGEQHVLEEMREAGASRPLVLRADVIPEIDRDER